MRQKTCDLQIKAAGDDAGTFEGYGSVFGTRDSYNEVVVPGAFADSLAKHRREGTRPLMLWSHDPTRPIGVWQDMSEDGKGLRVKGKLLLSVQAGAEAYEYLKADAVRGLSIGYREVDTEPADGNSPKRLVKLDLMEVSLVAFPANARAGATEVKQEKWDRWEDFARALRDGEPRPIKDFEDLLRDAGVPKAMACAIASQGYAKAIRRDSEGKANEQARDLAAMRDAVKAFLPSI